jgi:hypothetical protein
MEYVLSAGGGPDGQKLVMGVGERPASADRHQAFIANAGQDHAIIMPVSHTKQPVVTSANRSSGGDPFGAAS